ncbi:hypothetical protein AAC03nite_20160 [Alicyclobacillus acidoterrestris]|nr:hypothetical protein AAC03nite_20160 [Alicyclobacillus acidoterrestris]
MAALEELVSEQLLQDTTLSGMLAQFAGSPAIFEYRAPADSDSGWDGQKQYPRMDYMVERQEDPERRVSGMLMINIWHDTSADDETTVEEVAARVQAILDGAMYHPDDEPVIGLRWSKGQFFTTGREQGDVSISDIPPSDLINAMYLEFDLLAFPLQETFSPDPIASLTQWSTETFKGLQSDPTTWTPTEGEPALYWRFESFQVAKVEPSVTWYDATLYGHVLAPMPQDRLTWVRRICEQLLNDRTVTMENGSWMIIQKLTADTKQDQLRVGQIRMTVRYGIQVPQTTTDILQHAYVR